MAAGLFFGAKLSGLQEKYGIAGSDSPKLETVRKLVSRYYFEDLDADSLTDRMVIAMLETLDPHSSYMNARDMREHEAEMMGEFEGIGITFNILNDTITVVSVVPGGPSQHGGLSAGDRIVTIDGENVAGVKIQNSEVIRKLRGPKGTKVRVGVVSPVLDYPLQMEIVRDKIPLHSVDVAYMIAPGIGYVQIHSFSATTGKEFSNALDFLNSQGMKKLVLDLRGNPGGALQSAVEVCDELLEQRKVIVSTRGKSIGEAVYRATAAGDFQREDQELVVLIDEWSASAAEIVAGAVQDQDRGLIIGRRSFWKGLVQRSFTLADSSEVLLTVARYYTPTGRCIQKPFDGYEEELVNRYLRGEMQNPDSMPLIDSLKFKTPKGKIVYGGGGIVPDIFVPVDTSEEYVAYNRLSQAGILFRFALEYSDAHRIDLQEYKDVRAFDHAFSVTDAMVGEIVRRGEDADVSPGRVGALARNEIKTVCKAYIARNFFGEEGFAYIMNQKDKAVLKALQVLRKK